jgi:hypothetical protein
VPRIALNVRPFEHAVFRDRCERFGRLNCPQIDRVGQVQALGDQRRQARTGEAAAGEALADEPVAAGELEGELGLKLADVTHRV